MRSLALVRGRPAWSLIVVGLALVVAALLYTWNIGGSGLSTYYAASAVSMASSPHDLLVGALNRSGTTTLDKLSGFLVPQALAVRLFGVHAWALTLPQAIEGVVTVFAAYVLGVRWRGPVVGAATAVVVTFTPMLAAMFGHPMEDGMLTMAVALAMVAAQRAALTGHGAWLLLAAAWVAVGFQAKMLQAWFVVPAVLALYFVGAAGPLRRRLLWAVGAGAAAAGLSVSWISVISLLPDRPYADGTTNGNLFTMVFGYNGVDRLVPGAIPGSVPQLAVGGGQSTGHPHALGQPPALTTRMQDAVHSPIKLLLPEIATQLGWLYPLALAGAAWEAVTTIGPLRRRLPADATDAAPRDRIDRAMLVALLLWAGMTALLLAPAEVPHATYFGMIAVPIALLAVVGATAAVRLLRDRVPGLRWAAPLLTLATACWAAATIAAGPRPFVALSPVVLVLGVAGAGLLAGAIVRGGRRLLAAGLAVALATGALSPVLWSSFVLVPGGGGSASDAYAGPRVDEPTAAGERRVRVARSLRTGIRAPFAIPSDSRLDPAQRALVAYVTARAGSTRPLFATDTLAIAVSVILDTRYDALPMGGFSRQAPFPSTAGLRGWIRDGTVRYVLLADPQVWQPPNPTLAADRAWVRAACAPVLHGRYRAGTRESQTLYDCGAAR